MITLHSNNSKEVTTISNIFIDNFMPAANGSYVKVYLYLLRCICSNTSDITISSIADKLDDSEKDIIRALQYFEKMHLLKLEKDSDDTIIDILVIDLSSNEIKSEATVISESSVALVESTSQVINDSTSNKANNNSLDTKKVLLERPTYSPSQIKQLTETDEIKWLLNIIEIYLERLLKPADIQLILYLYENLNFSTELIMYLYEYCVSKNKRNASYVEAVALSWAEEGIDSVEKAEINTCMYNNNYNEINKAFGLNRAPGAIERKYINTWLTQYGFSINIIVEACNRTILRTQKPDFKYADKILSNWHDQNVKTIEDIAEADKNHHKTVASKTTKVSNVTPTASPNNNNKFNAFPQRNYSKEDYSAMEKRLLNNQ